MHPHDVPPHGTAYYDAKWRDEGIFAQFDLELTEIARAKEGRAPEPSAAIIDTLSVKTSVDAPVETQGTDAAKLIVGRKRSIAADALGLLPPSSSAPLPSPRRTPEYESPTRPRPPTPRPHQLGEAPISTKGAN
jgi:hypothetical protein